MPTPNEDHHHHHSSLCKQWHCETGPAMPEGQVYIAAGARRWRTYETSKHDLDVKISLAAAC